MLSELTEAATFTFAFYGGYGFGVAPVSHSSTSYRSDLFKQEGWLIWTNASRQCCTMHTESEVRTRLRTWQSSWEKDFEANNSLITWQ